MASNVRTPAAGAARALEIVAVGTDDGFQIAPPALKIQTARLRARFDLSPALAAVVAGHCYTVTDRWGRA